jgi:hypothetical protein
MDQIGPWAVQVHGKPYKFEALTVMDTVTTLVELLGLKERIRIMSCKSSRNVG